MWASNEAAKRAGSETHIAIRIDNLRFDGGSDKQSRVDLMAKSLLGVGFIAQRTDIRVGLTPDQGKRVRYQAIAIAAPTDKILPGCTQSWTGSLRASSSFMGFRALDRSAMRSAAT